MADSSARLNSSLSDANFKLSCESVLSKLVPTEKSRLDSILASNRTDQAEILLENGDKFVWYLAIGSMINPISLYLRDLVPLFSYPAICLDHRVIFRGTGGMADIEASTGSNFHGVVHLLTNDQMTHLDGIEAFYHRIPVTCLDYENRKQVAFAYQMNTVDQPAGIPHERYLDIIVKGCEYYRVQSDYIERLRLEQPVVPRKKPEQFRSITDVPPDVFFTREELQQHNGSDPSLPIWLSVNGKILEYVGPLTNDQSGVGFPNRFQQFIREKLAGREMTGATARALYEPLYKVPLNDDDISADHRVQLEDHCCNMLNMAQNPALWKPIGRLRQ